MKKNLNYIVLIIFSMIVSSCQKDSFKYKDGYVGISKITTYPIITVVSPGYTLIQKGGTFTDPGVSAKAGTEDVTVVTTNMPDVNTAGVYTVTYTATNTDGFSATDSRTVVVYSTDASAAANDFSGTYARNTNASEAEWTKLAPGVYSVFNPGGAPGTDFTVIMFNQTGNEVFIPQQIVGGALTSSSDESSTSGAAGTLSQYKMAIINPGYGTAVRIFNKI